MILEVMACRIVIHQHPEHKWSAQDNVQEDGATKEADGRSSHAFMYVHNTRVLRYIREMG